MMIEIYGTSNCAACKQAAELCKAADLEYKYYTLDEEPDLIEELEQRIGRVTTVPQIFIDGEHVGGLHSFKAKAGAING